MKNLELRKISNYICPPVQRVVPVKIKENYEYIEIITGGKVYFELDGSVQLFERGTIFWHLEDEYTICETDERDPYECIVITLKNLGESSRKHRVSQWAKGDVIDFALECFQAFHSNEVDFELLMEYIYSTLSWKNNDSLSLNNNDSNPIIKQALKFMNKNFSGNIVIKDIADYVNVSSSYLFTIFNRYFKVSPIKHLQSIRIEQAKILLSSGVLSIKEIAYNCGFESVEVFYRQFKKHSKITPSEYRLKYSTKMEIYK